MPNPLLLHRASSAPQSNKIQAPQKSIWPIVLGVLGGVLVNVILCYAVYYFCLKGKRRPIYQVVEDDELDLELGRYEDVMDRQAWEGGGAGNKRWSRRTKETRWSSIRTESLRWSDERDGGVGMKGLPPVPIILEGRGEERG
ncbi:hypothetical protein IQ06DRAFT_290410 [Phaeosphaeriaceae sp. SRC1lsM3a]|nr:hypothetical protein IQ06DRAFT_290410 [Stagonospora sp. SRC1lsM3a]